jgi:phosphatidylserine synthase
MVQLFRSKWLRLGELAITCIICAVVLYLSILDLQRGHLGEWQDYRGLPVNGLVVLIVAVVLLFTCVVQICRVFQRTHRQGR